MKKRIAIIFSAAFVILSVAACGEDGYKAGNIGKGYSISRVPYNGGYVNCIVRTSGTKDGYNVRSISCDFVAFHHVGRK